MFRVVCHFGLASGIDIRQKFKVVNISQNRVFAQSFIKLEAELLSFRCANRTSDKPINNTTPFKLVCVKKYMSLEPITVQGN